MQDMTTEEARAAIAKIAALYEYSFQHIPTTPKEAQIKWAVTFKRGRIIGDFSYSAGIAHLPCYATLKGPKTTLHNEAIIAKELHTGRDAHRGRRIDPSAVDVLSCLARDAEAMQHDRFESWADDYGYDHDSRAAERIYKECVRAGLFLNATLDHVQFTALQDAARAL